MTAGTWIAVVQSMEILEFLTFHGPSIYCPRAALVMRLDPGPWAGKKIGDFPTALARLSSVLSKLKELAEVRNAAHLTQIPLPAETSLTQTVAAVAHQLHCATGIAIGPQPPEPRFNIDDEAVAAPFVSKKATRYLLESAIEIVNAALRNRTVSVDPILHAVNRILKKTGLSFNTIAIIKSAEERGIPWARLPRPNLVQLGNGRNRRLVQSSWTDRTSLVAAEIAGQKHISKQFLQRAGLPVPRGHMIRSELSAVEAFRRIGAPVVVKPANGKQGLNVSLDLRTETEVTEAYFKAAAHCERVLIEAYAQGRDFRVLVLAGKYTASVERVPAHIIGDGRHSITELVALANESTMRGEGHTSPWCLVRFGEDEIAYIEKNGLRPTDIPPMGAQVFLRKSANGSAGGTSRDVTDEVHPHYRAICEKAARILGLDVCGVDLIAPDIKDPSGGCWILEINHRPGLQPHLHPTSGTGRNVARSLVDALFPGSTPYRIPTIAVLGEAAQSPARKISIALATRNRHVGLAGSDAESAAAVFWDPVYDTAVVQLSPPEILHSGLPFSECDVAVLTQSFEDNRTLDLMISRVKDGGWVIIDSDCAEALPLANHIRSNHPAKRVEIQDPLHFLSSPLTEECGF